MISAPRLVQQLSGAPYEIRPVFHFHVNEKAKAVGRHTKTQSRQNASESSRIKPHQFFKAQSQND